MAKIRIKRSSESYSIFVIINQAVFSLNGIDKIENGATGCPILLVSTVEYRILYTKGNWIEGKNVIMLYYIFWFFGYWRNNSFGLFTESKVHRQQR